MKTNLITALIASLLLIPKGSYSQEPSQQFPPYQRIINMAIIPLFAIPLVHESGHGLFAWMAGADSIAIYPFTILPYEKHYLNPQLTSYNLREGLIFAGGALTTRLTAQILHILLNSTNPPRWIEGVGGGLSTMMRVDLPVQYLWGCVYSVCSISKGRPDFTGIAENLFRTTFLNTAFYIVSGLLITLDIYLSWNAIRHDFRRAIGKPH
ncbi:MAG: hypothetical protein FJ215_11370 [Ignavibacteria bacterium]|nr:hypothetical protein [Ignavibacteria bacterium]